MRNIPAPTFFGIEYTFVANSDWVELQDIISHLTTTTFLTQAMDDCGAIEIASPPVRTIKAHKKFYSRMMRLLDRLPVTARRVEKLPGQEIYHGTGGGHIHMQIDTGQPNKYTYAHLRNMLILVANAPWLGWVFNEFMDDDNARVFCNSGSHFDLMRMLAADANWRPHDVYMSAEMKTYDAVESLMDTLSGGYHALRISQGGARRNINRPGKVGVNARTIEFRFFDAPRSWEQAQEHLNIAFGIYNKALKLAKAGKKPELVCKSIRDVVVRRSRAFVEREFRIMVEEFGLDWRVYKKYMENFDDRRRYGKLI